jgi:exopolysaccharide biosynthesis polyprenyl glycosylphosphotransferase
VTSTLPGKVKAAAALPLPKVGGALPRVALHQRARETGRRHLLFSWGRVTALVASDLGTFFLLRFVLSHIVKFGVLGEVISRFLGGALPYEYFTGSQFPAAMVVGLALAGTYGRADARRDTSSMFAGIVLASALCLWRSAWTIGSVQVAIQFVGCVIFAWLPLVLERYGIDVMVSKVWPEQHRVERVLFVGDPSDPIASRVSDKLLGSGGMVSLGWVYDPTGPSDDGCIGRLDDYWNILHEAAADTAVVFGTLPSPIFDSVVEASTAAGCRILVVPRHEGASKLRHGVVWHRGLPFVELTVPSLRAQQLLVKRVIDALGAAIGLMLLSPAVLLLALAIKVDSAGPVFFSQERVGLGGRVFRFFKFRTMRVGADEEKQSLAHLNHTGDPRLFKIRNDPRVTRIGGWLRRWSFDELPQLWNVFVGDMSLVGPRPFFESDLEAYRDHHFVRLGAKPGITGLWQVNGRSDLPFDEGCLLDIYYIENWTLEMDLQIILQTIPRILVGTGAY